MREYIKYKHTYISNKSYTTVCSHIKSNKASELFAIAIHATAHINLALLAEGDRYH